MIDASAPYDSAPAKPPKPMVGIEYMRSFLYVFENPNWIANVLFVGLCALSTGVIPVIGQLIMQGYQFSIIEALHREPGSQYPDFDMNKLLDYLLRGFWIFLVGLVVGLAMLPILVGLGFLFVVLGFAVRAAIGEDGAAIAVMVLAPILFCVFLVLNILLAMIFLPFTLRAGLTQDFGASFDFGFTKQFIRNTWKEMILCGLFSALAGLLLAMAGLAMLCVGAFFTMSIAALIHTHLLFQLYELHLARGGDVIEIPTNSPPQ